VNTVRPYRAKLSAWSWQRSGSPAESVAARLMPTALRMVATSQTPLPDSAAPAAVKAAR
jgi:hypothetical protein